MTLIERSVEVADADVDADVDVDVSAFPAGFAWGAATAAYQVEGAVSEGGRGPSIWDTFAHTPGKTKRGETGDVACDHYHRWESDLDLIRELGLRAYRLSVSWARLQPLGTGPLNPLAVAYYRSLLSGLRERGVRAYVTLYHWDLPQVVEDAGGWPSRDTASRFAEFAALTVQALGDLADDWITVNEPWCSSFLGYGTGKHAPGRTDLSAAVAAAHHLNLAHGLATQAIRAQRPVAVGRADIVTDLVAGSSRVEDQEALRRVDANNNRMFLDPVLRGGYPRDVIDLYSPYGLPELIRDGDQETIGVPIDFLGVNHYHRLIVTADPRDAHLGAHTTAAEPQGTSVRWSVVPDSLRQVLVRIATDYPALPLFVTENGAAYDDHVNHLGQVIDSDRVAYLRGYVQAAAQAIRQGVNLQGYFVWSLMDNFEWAEGYGARFGIVYVDYRSQARIPKASAAWYRDLIGRHARTVG
jgi:beta-glucosidase